ncbi:hypothetical protein [Methanolobus profundi]|uniref:Uncharacterized protein n=1 Tax=Methanolobus profundi TaxID=487685 RepID=A0A1I4TUJ2_9EURY|nr:hypothetical protein [Methanolobus profundi]SFM80247.1 hypothetical protein SAMN04488696_2462 [Methanolobus profundi]
MRTALLYLTAILLIVSITGTSFAADRGSDNYDVSVVDIYSDLDTCDITLHSSEQVSGLELEMTMEHEGSTLDKRKFSIDMITPDSDVTKAFEWDTDDKGDGKYTVNTMISKDGCVIYENAYNFVNGRQTIPRATVDDLVPNSQGFSVMITPQEAVVVDVEYMLIDGSDVIYSGTEKKISVHTQPMEVTKDWNVLLENNKEYTGRIKVKMYSPSVTYIALSEDFVAQDDVFISDTYEDDIGASATVDGISQVPFEGSVRFTVSKQDDDGENVIESVTQKSPILLNEDDETVETIWEERLTTGIYSLVIEVIGNDGDILDVEEKIIESDHEPSTQQTNNTGTEDAEESPGFMLSGSLFLIAIVALMSRKR